MQFKISTPSSKKTLVLLLSNASQLAKTDFLSKSELSYAQTAIKQGQKTISINQYGRFIYLCMIPSITDHAMLAEQIRVLGCTLKSQLAKEQIHSIHIANKSSESLAAYYLAEGISLASYQFTKYLSDAKKRETSLSTIEFDKSSITLKDLAQLSITIEAVSIARNLINEPLNSLGATELAAQISALGKLAGFKTTTLRKVQIVKEKMGGILAVNRGSIDPPTFSIMEHKPAKFLNKQPIVLIGKGIVYDTGGLSLKPTPNSMDKMKSDMSGAALVSAAMYAIAKMQLPLHVIALVPATDNRPGENAYVPGDIIKMYDGSTVEVLNTDAEGRMVLADALHWAKRYKPELVIDFATLTGAAAAITGAEGMIYMGTASDAIKQKFEKSGHAQHERMVQLPLWPEYAKMIQSDIADLKNIGGPFGGAITAGKFLEHFTAYPWLHFDISGVSYTNVVKDYKGTGGTGFGLRMLLNYLAHYGK